MTGLRSELLFEMRLETEPSQVVGAAPNGDRRIRYVSGGRFEGPKLRGEVLPGGGDWLLLRPDGARTLAIRLTLRTDNGDLIYIDSRGLLNISADCFQRIAAGEEVDPAEYYFRTTPLFETASKELDWLNRVVAVSVGRLTASAAVHTLYAIL